MRIEDLEVGDKVIVKYDNTYLSGTISAKRWFGMLRITISSHEAHYLAGRDLITHSSKITHKT